MSTILTGESSSPLYRQLMTRLREDIAAGKYPVGGRIPSELALVDAYQVSRVTVRKALLELTREGLLKRRQGKGTFVCSPRLCKDLRDVNSFTDACRLQGSQPGTRVIHAQIVRATQEEQERLNIPDGQLVETMRLRTADGVPVMLEINHFPMAYAWLLQENLEVSLYGLLEKRDISPRRGIHEVSLCYATAAQAKLLDVTPESALLLLSEVVYDQHGLPLHTSNQVIRGDRFTFRI